MKVWHSGENGDALLRQALHQMESRRRGKERQAEIIKLAMVLSPDERRIVRRSVLASMAE